MSDALRQEESIFKVACEIQSEEAREAYLNQVCGDDEQLRRRIVTLLRVDAEQGTFVRSVEESDAENFSSNSHFGDDKQIGPYKILQKLGEGGMGAVYMAEQTEPVKRRVALKLIKGGMDSADVIARFEAERQALAMMDHPNVAKVLDAGTSQSGRPYFVMELVKGVPITEYCDEHHLSARERLELFLGACRGIQHAHYKGIIHRDLKPSNVLVAEYDHQPVAKIIDFGVAKATHQELTEKTLFTQFGQIVGTLDYMSPEQAKFNQLDIDSRSDVYSLGVLLYELLTGSTPIEKERLKNSGLDEILRVIREEDPPRPSTRLSASDTLPSLAANRSTDPAKLAGELRDDLDWIVIKAMAKERSERYLTAEALAADIERHLNDLPIEARRPSFIGRARRFVRRHKVPVAMSLLIALVGLIAVGFGIAARFAHVKQQEQQADLLATEAEKERLQQLERERTLARQVAIPKIRELIEDRRPVEAFLLANDIQELLADDREYQQLRKGMTVVVSFPVKPEGTTIAYRDALNPDGEWVVAGQSPLVDVELPRGDLRFRYSHEGYQSREFQRKFPDFVESGYFKRPIPNDQVISGTTRIDGIRAESWNGLPEDLGKFYIDRYEVTNSEFQEFVEAGGYENPEYWSEIDFERDGTSVTWEDAIKSFVDSTGAPGPATWKEGQPQEGQGDYPVGGVSWFEAKAYAAYRKKSLPTVHHWRWAARTNQPGIVVTLSNFANAGPAARGTHDGIGHFDVYDLAGNVKEWCHNERGKYERCLCGGAWNEAEYMFHHEDSDSPWSRKPTYGFRCVTFEDDRGAEELTLTPVPMPVSPVKGLERKPLESLIGRYQYDRQLPLDAELIQSDSPDPSPDYRYEIVRITAAYNNERFDLHLLWPRQHQQPLETIIWVPGSGGWSKTGHFGIEREPDRRYFHSLPKSGRLVCFPVYKGTFERGGGTSIHERFRTAPLQARDMLIAAGKDFSRAIDYLVTRPEVDQDRLLLFGLSLGACVGPVLMMSDSRLDAAVLLSGGYFSNALEFPEIHPYHFTPHVKIPVLMISGAPDGIFPIETAQKPMFEDLGSDIKEHVILVGGHNPPQDRVFDTIVPWLERVFERANTKQ